MTTIDAIRRDLDHPVIDADGHTLEYIPALLGYLEREGLAPDLGAITAGIIGPGAGRWADASDAVRRERRIVRPPWWAVPSGTYDIATAMFPQLMYERMPELGLDFAVLYTSVGLTFPHIDDRDVRVKACRALNRYNRDVFADYRDRLCPAAVVPMHTPEEGIEALDDALAIGLKTILIPSWVRRTVPIVEAQAPQLARYGSWFDTYGVDSAYDYDPFWARCVDAGVSVATHSPMQGWGTRQSVSSYMHNHLGQFAASAEALARSLFLGGVTRRFPALRIGLLEGGANWGVALLNDLIGHWEKRHLEALDVYDPRNTDGARLEALFRQHGPKDVAWVADLGLGLGGDPPDAGSMDEFARCGISTVDDIRDLFVPSFFFGCEADDPMTYTAFNSDRNPWGVSLHAMFGSDIGHWDVPDFSKVLPEAYEPFEKGWLSRADLRAFLFENPYRYFTESNPSFFEGTVIESFVASENA